jgi:GNAT superfamily N-acetyltransferase
MEFAEERAVFAKKEMQSLLDLHWELIALNKDKIKLNPDWNQYIKLNDAGIIKLFTARKNGKLVGYFAVSVSPSLHYKDHIYAVNDVIFIHPDHRDGSAGYKLIKYAEQRLSNMGVSLMMINTKTHQPFDKLLERMGFNLIERVYSKYIGK